MNRKGIFVGSFDPFTIGHADILSRALTVDFAHRVGANFIIKGARTIKDFEYEREQAVINRRIGNIETLLLYADPHYDSISSSMVRELIHFGKDIKEFLP